MSDSDLVIKNGTVVDGTGAPPRRADVAIRGREIVAVGDDVGKGQREIDAEGLLVTPGFVDIHTHYDAQATWDPYLTPTSLHGVTSIVMGNCGVGFAPVRPQDHDFLIGLMEGVEDIPGTALHEGIDWQWESFPEYLTALEGKARVLDVATQVPHGAVRAYVMGERGAKNEPATAKDIQEMAAIVREAIEAGALGFSMSRTIVHRAVDGEVCPGTHAAEDEIFGICRGFADLGKGLVELAPAGVQGEDMSAPVKEYDWMGRLSAETGLPVTFALVQHDVAPDDWRQLLALCDAAGERGGAQLRPQVSARPNTLLIGHQTFHPFSYRPTYTQLADLPLEKKIAKLRDPQIRKQILGEKSVYPVPSLEVVVSMIENGLDKIFRLGDPPDYEPPPEQSVKSQAAAQGVDAFELLYDWLLEMNGKQLLMLTLLNYSELSLDPVREMLLHPRSAFGLGDGGAHCGAICDASMTTSLLSLWARDRSRGEKLSIEWAVRKMTRDTAELYGMRDRGVLAPGMKGDLNVIDFDRLSLALPEVAHDLPSGAKRLIQRARGYDATVVSGQVTFREGEATGVLPGRLVRGPQQA